MRDDELCGILRGPDAKHFASKAADRIEELNRPDASGLIEAAEWPFGHRDTFNLISDATGLVGGHIGISVSKFEKAYNKLCSRAAGRSRISEK